MKNTQVDESLLDEPVSLHGRHILKMANGPLESYMYAFVLDRIERGLEPVSTLSEVVSIHGLVTLELIKFGYEPQSPSEDFKKAKRSYSRGLMTGLSIRLVLGIAVIIVVIYIIAAILR